MNRTVALISLLIAILSANGQQHIQWYDVSNFAPSVKQCKIGLTDDRLFVYVFTGDKDVNFWVGEPQRSGALIVLNGDDAMEFRQAIFNEFIEESLRSLPANATVQQHIQPRADKNIIDPLANLEIEVQPVDKELLEQGLFNEEIADYYAKKNEGNHANSKTGNTDNAMSGVMQHSSSGQFQQQDIQDTKQSNTSDDGLNGIVANIFMLVISFWLLKAVLKAFFGSSNKSKRDKNYDDGPAWFHDHGQNI